MGDWRGHEALDCVGEALPQAQLRTGRPLCTCMCTSTNLFTHKATCMHGEAPSRGAPQYCVGVQPQHGRWGSARALRPAQQSGHPSVHVYHGICAWAEGQLEGKPASSLGLHYGTSLGRHAE